MLFGLRGVNVTQRSILRLRAYLGLIFLALMIPTFFLVNKGYSHFQYESFFKYRWRASNIANQLDKQILEQINIEQQRKQSDYQFISESCDNGTAKSTYFISPLATPGRSILIPGLVGYFQTDPSGEVSNPALQLSKGQLESELSLSGDELKSRQAQLKKMAEILISEAFIKAPHKSSKTKTVTNTTSILKSFDDTVSPSLVEDKINCDESRPFIGPFNTRRTHDGHLIFFRDLLIGNQIFNQGFIVIEQAYFSALINDFFDHAGFASPVEVTLLIDDKPANQWSFHPAANKLTIKETIEFNIEQQKSFVLYESRLVVPLQSYRLHFTMSELPWSESTKLLVTMLLIVFIIILLGLYVFYRAGLKQIQLAEERLNFVSAVSHELKTPLTSTTLYIEMLRAKMVPDETKKQRYYDFIFYECERLSRLINNVLSLSNLSARNTELALEYFSVEQLVEIIDTKMESQLTKHDFTLNYNFDEKYLSAYQVLLDKDAFIQIVINLVDNAIKFFDEEATGAPRRIEVSFSVVSSDAPNFCMSVRDFGPGIKPGKVKRIFDLFYRSGKELRRTKPGTGIGLALVSKLMQAMSGRVEYVDAKPGAKFCLYFQSRIRQE